LTPSTRIAPGIGQDMSQMPTPPASAWGKSCLGVHHCHPDNNSHTILTGALFPQHNSFGGGSAGSPGRATYDRRPQNPIPTLPAQ
jgi:hypothetical protein